MTSGGRLSRGRRTSTIHPKRAAVAFDVTAETMLRYYTATEKKRTADEVLSELQAQMMPKKASNGEAS